MPSIADSADSIQASDPMRTTIKTKTAATPAVLACCVFACLLVPASNAPALDIISAQYRIFGDWTESWFEIPRDESGQWNDELGQLYQSSSNFDFSSNFAPLSATVVSSPFGWESASATVDSFNIAISSGSTLWGNEIYTDDSLIIVQHETHVNIFAEAVTRFRPVSTEMALSVTGQGNYNYDDGQYVRWLLQDLTSAAVLLDIVMTPNTLNSPWPADGTLWVSESFNVAFDLSHEYELTLAGWIPSFDVQDTTMQGKLSVLLVSGPPGNAVPDTGSTLAALGVGLLALVGACHRRSCQS